MYGQAVWAPCLRYHDGTFYIFADIRGQKSQIFSAQDPAGPWKRRSMDNAYHDLSVLFDDSGKKYVTWGYQDLKLAELSDDQVEMYPVEKQANMINSQRANRVSLHQIVLMTSLAMSAVAGLLEDSKAEPTSVRSEFGPETGWAEFTSFKYEGHDPAYDKAPPSATEFYNPILAGFYPDPSICRVGNDYYLINSSFSFYPGVPIFHSTDLVSWNQIGHILDRPSQLNLDGLPVSSGIFAPTITRHDGMFHMITTNVRGIGNFYVTAKDPAGPWSDPIPLAFDGIDPSFFFDDDGKSYVVHNGPPPENKSRYDGHRAIWLWDFNPEAKAVKNGRIIVNGGVDISQKPSWIEGPHIFKRNGWYYLTCAEGGTGPNHSQVIFRTKSLDEPFVPAPHNPILTQRGMDPKRPNPITALGHADLVETTEGEWWAVFLGIRPYEGGLSNIGRETFLLPVNWENGWPVILNPGEVMPLVVKRPEMPQARSAVAPSTGTFSWHDEFDAKALGLDWIVLRTPRENWSSLQAKPGSLLIAPRPDRLDSQNKADARINQQPSFIARRQQHTNFSASTTVVVDSATTDSEIGLAALQNNGNYFFLGVRVARGAAKEIFLEEHDETSEAAKVIASAPLPAGTNQIELQISAVFA